MDKDYVLEDLKEEHLNRDVFVIQIADDAARWRRPFRRHRVRFGDPHSVYIH